jgi:hypothetical protein
LNEGTESTGEQNLKEARSFAWDHFDLHAKQRMEMFRSYVTFIAVVYAGYGWSIQAKEYWIGALLGLFAIFLSFSFFLFDQRIRQLLKISERYLLDDEKRLSKLISNPNIRLFHKSDLITHFDAGYFRLTYSNLFRGVYLGNILVAVLLWLLLIAVSSLRS